MIHLDRELHKLAIALGCEKQGRSVALVCAGSAKFSVYLMANDASNIVQWLGDGATASEAIASARANNAVAISVAISGQRRPALTFKAKANLND
jgi:hypothetical protein